MIGNYNAELARWEAAGRPVAVEKFVDQDPAKISWSSSLRDQIARGAHIRSDELRMSPSIYRPFYKQVVSAHRPILHRPAVLDRFFPSSGQGTVGFYLNGVHAHAEFAALAMDEIPCLDIFGKGGQFFARYSYTQPTPNALFDEPERVDNITDWALGEYQREFGAQVTKDDIFFYVYGLLHSPEYRERYASDLKKQLPRIPMVSGRDRFEAFADAGRKLSELHIGYENVEPYPLTEVSPAFTPSDPFDKFEVKKMKYGGKAGAWDKTRIQYNSHIDIEGIPEDAQRYMLGSRSALDWIIERYQVKTDAASGIVNDPNDWSREHEQPRYIIDLIGRIVTVSIETLKVVDALPDLNIAQS